MFVGRNTSARTTCLLVGAVVAAILLLVCIILLIVLFSASNALDEEGTPIATFAPAPPEGAAVISVLDVDQGQAVAVIAPDGSAALIDAGRSGTRIEQEVAPYLRSLGVEELDYLIISHPDQDHIGGMPRVLELFPVETWVDPAIPTTNQTYAQVLETVIDQDIPAILARQGEQLLLGDTVTLELLWPVDDMLTSGGEPDSNENSAVVRVTYDGVSVLIPGDLENRGERALIDQYGADLLSDVLVAGHHGSNTSSSGAFLDAVAPDVAIISAGEDNPYGHPHDEVLQRLRFRGIAIYRTDVDGTVNVIIEDGQYEIETVVTDARE